MALDLDCLTTEYYTGDGVKTAYNLPFDFVEESDIKVSWHSSVVSEYTTKPSNDPVYGYSIDVSSGNSFVRFANPPANGQKFFIYRLTAINPLKSDFEAGHPVKAQDLDDNFKQLANAIEDTRCIVEGIIDQELIDTGDIYWKKAGETVYSNNDWASSDCYVASTKAIEQRFSTLVHMGIDPPPTPNYDGQLWWDTDDGNLYVFYTDSDSNQWVEANVSTGEAPNDGLIYGRKDGNWSVVPVWQTGYVNDVPDATGLSYFRTSGAVAGDAGTWTATNVYPNADQTKLAGIETGATADQTGAEIKTAYEAEADTNAYDDAAVTKLAGIATGAQVNDPNTVVDANYVATDENFTTADHTKLDGIETGAQVNAANTVIDANYVATDENFTTADHTKLDGIETGAQVNAANTVIDPNYVATDENFTTADHAKLDGIETAATADQTGTEIKALYEAEANAYTDAKNTKLSGIETGATADQTAAEILTAVKTVDGTGSGLDADLLDGQEGSYYLDYNNLSNAPSGGLWTSSGSDIYYNSGNVGIGTASFPANGTNLKTTDSTIARHILEKSGSNARTFEIGNGGTFLNIYDATADSERLRIDSSGNVLVGTTTANGSMTVNMGTDKNISFSGGVSEVGSVPALQATNTAGSSLASMGFRGTDLRFATGSAERMRIDSSGNVGIGCTPQITGTGLDITGSTDSQLRLHTGNTGATTGDGLLVSLANNNDGYFWNYENNPLIFGTNHTERMRITSSGTITINTPLYNSTAQLQLDAKDTTAYAPSTAYPPNQIQLHNSVAMGSAIMNFRTQSNQGSAGIWNVGAVPRTASLISDFIFQSRTADTTYSEIARFSGNGGILFNGDTAQANALDDYEEGTFTPVLCGSTTNGSFTPHNLNGGMYIKIGSVVHAMINCQGNLSGAAGNYQVKGLPFNAVNSGTGAGNAGFSTGSLQYWNNSGADVMGPLTQVGTSYIYFHTYDGDSSGNTSVNNSTGHNLHCCVTYRVA